MSVRLQLETGEIYDYRTWYSQTVDENGPTTYHTKCGIFWDKKPPLVGGCGHIECAINVSESEANRFKVAMRIEVVLMLPIVFILHSLDSGMVMFITIYCIILILVIAFFFWIHDKEYRELVEFRDHGTVNGIRAEQI